MDPISQAAVGAAAAQTAAPDREKFIACTIIGALAGMAPDLDVLIRSSTDPLLAMEFHRHFTHALIFIPFGALIVAGALYPFARKRLDFTLTYIAALAGYATHGLLDACTSYGTQLLWPFFDTRVAWNNISVVDPLFTIPLVTCLIIAAVRRSHRFTAFGISWALLYLSLGGVQYFRAVSAVQDLAASRNHTAAFVTVKPSFGNLILWKSIYRYRDDWHIDSIRTARSTSSCGGGRIKAFDWQDMPDYTAPESQQWNDVQRFYWFSQGYLAEVDKRDDLLTLSDVRYSMVPDSLDPLWRIDVRSNKSPEAHVVLHTNRALTDQRADSFLNQLLGKGCQTVGSK